MRYNKLIFMTLLLFLSYALICEQLELFDISDDEIKVRNHLFTSSLEDTHILEWNFTWGGNYHESAYALNYDSLGNVYITGLINDTITGKDDVFLAKFKG